MRPLITMITTMALLAACGSGGASGKTNGGGTSSGSSSGGTGSSGGGNPVTNPTCPAGCPSGEFCFDGLCAVGCMSDSNCASNQYCDTEWTHLCQDKTVASCSANSDCQSGQLCVEGLCSATLTQQPPQPCNPNANLASGQSDGCDSTSVCLQQKDSSGNPVGAPYCQSFPACGAPGSNPECPVGQYGSLCNDGYLPAKGRFCMPGTCKTAVDCPSSWGCVMYPSGPGLGACSNGSFGSVCDSTHPCESGLTCYTEMGSFGQCISGGFGTTSGGTTSGGSTSGGTTSGGTTSGGTTSGGTTSGGTTSGGTTSGGTTSGGSTSGGSTSGGSTSGGSTSGSCSGTGQIGGTCSSNCDCQSDYCQINPVSSVCCSGPGQQNSLCQNTCDCQAGLGCSANGSCCSAPGSSPSGQSCFTDCECQSLNCKIGTCA